MIRNRYTFFDIILCISFLLNSVSVYSKSNYSHRLNYASLFIAAMCLLFVLLSNMSKEVWSKAIYIGFICIVVGCLPFFVLYFVQQSDISKQIFRFVLIVPICSMYLFLRSLYGIKVVLRNFVNAYIILVIPGFIIWVLYSLGVVSTNMSLDVSWGSYTTVNGVYGIEWFTQYSDINLSIGKLWKFTSVFIEAPAFAAFAVLFGCISIYLADSSLVAVLIIVISGLCSFTTTAYLGFGLLLLPLLYKAFYNSKTRISKFLFLAIGVLCILGSSLVFVKIMSNKIATFSGGIHLLDFLSGLKAFIDNPIFGHGVNDYRAAWLQFASDHQSGVSQTSTLMSVLSQGGLLYLFPFIYPLFTMYKSEMKIYKPFVICFLILFSICIAFEDSFITYLLISFGYIDMTNRSGGKCFLRERI